MTVCLLTSSLIAFHSWLTLCFVFCQSQPKLLQAQADDGLLPPIFSRVNPTTNVPVAGAWLVWLGMSIPAFMLDLEAITKVISCGNLMTYSFVTACGIALRFRSRETQTTERAPAEKYVWAFLVLSFATALALMKEASIYLSIGLGSLTAVTLGILWWAPQLNKPRRGHYTMPLEPVLPAVGIFFNFALACGLDGLTWAYFGAFVAIGLVIYFGYGMRHSNLEAATVTRGEFEVSLIDVSTTLVDEQLEGYVKNYQPPAGVNTESSANGEDSDSEYHLKEQGVIAR